MASDDGTLMDTIERLLEAEKDVRWARVTGEIQGHLTPADWGYLYAAESLVTKVIANMESRYESMKEEDLTGKKVWVDPSLKEALDEEEG